VASLDIIDADAAIIRRTASPHRNEVLDEIAAEYRAFKRMGPSFVRAFDFQGRAGMQPLRDAMAILADLDGDWRRALPDDVPLGHVEHRWRRHVMTAGGIDRTHWEMATYSALSNALASGGIWVPTARVHRALSVLLAPPASPVPKPAFSLGDPHAWLDERAARLDSALREVARDLDKRDPPFLPASGCGFRKTPKKTLVRMKGGNLRSPATAWCLPPVSRMCCRRFNDGPASSSISAMSRPVCLPPTNAPFLPP
jgi:hypothetical protein